MPNELEPFVDVAVCNVVRTRFSPKQISDLNFAAHAIAGGQFGEDEVRTLLLSLRECMNDRGNNSERLLQELGDSIAHSIREHRQDRILPELLRHRLFWLNFRSDAPEFTGEEYRQILDAKPLPDRMRPSDARDRSHRQKVLSECLLRRPDRYYLRDGKAAQFKQFLDELRGLFYHPDLFEGGDIVDCTCELLSQTGAIFDAVNVVNGLRLQGTPFLLCICSIMHGMVFEIPCPYLTEKQLVATELDLSHVKTIHEVRLYAGTNALWKDRAVGKWMSVVLTVGGDYVERHQDRLFVERVDSSHGYCESVKAVSTSAGLSYLKTNTHIPPIELFKLLRERALRSDR